MNAVTTELVDDRPPSRAVAQVSTPSDLLRMAVEQGADLDRLERLMILQERWEASQARKAYDEAFAAFKAEAVRIVKNRSVTDGPLKGKSYAELFAVLDAVTPALSKHGLSSSWKITKDEKDWIEVTCYLKHIAGHTETVSMGGGPDIGGAKNAIQARASTVSYLERYTFKAVIGMSEQGDDNDGGGDDGLIEMMADLIQQAKQTKTDAEAIAFWKEHSPKLQKDQKSYKKFKDEVGYHRTILKEAKS